MAVTTVDYNSFAPVRARLRRVPADARRGAGVLQPAMGLVRLTRFEDVRAAILDADTFRSFESMDIDDSALEQAPPGSLPNMDNPQTRSAASCGRTSCLGASPSWKSVCARWFGAWSPPGGIGGRRH